MRKGGKEVRRGGVERKKEEGGGVKWQRDTQGKKGGGKGENKVQKKP